MSDANLIMDKIREEHEKGLPSKRKILSYLLDLLNKDKYPSLSDIEFYDIVGETYKLNLDYKLKLKMLFNPIYNALKKKIKKLYGDEKRLEMEQYLIKNFGLFGTEHMLNRIKEKFDKAERDEFFPLFSKIFLDVYAKAIKFDIKIFYDFLGEILLEKPALLDGRKLKEYLRFVKKVKIPRNRLLELETYLIEKFKNSRRLF